MTDEDSQTQQNVCVLRCVKDLRQLYSLCQAGSDDIEGVLSGMTCIKITHDYLVAIELVAYGRGHISDNSIICVPTEEDVNNLNTDKSYPGPIAPRDKMAKLHKKNKNAGTKSELDVLMKNLLEKVEENVPLRASCSREVMGFVQKGGFQFHSGCGAGHGFVTLNGLLKTLRSQSNITRCRHIQKGCLVLFRETTSLQYRLATLRVML